VRDKGSGGTAGAASASKVANQVHATLSIDSKQEFEPQIGDFINSIGQTRRSDDVRAMSASPLTPDGWIALVAFMSA
jgi:hypothetical protein